MLGKGWLASTIKVKNETYSNSSLHLNYEKWENIPVKSYKKDLVILVVKTVKDIKSFTKARKGVFKIVNASVYCNASQYSVRAIKACQKFVFPQNR